MNSGERYEQARRLISSGQFKQARDLLLPIQHEAKASNWIQKIDAHLAKQSSTEQPPKTSPQKPSRITIIAVALLAAGFAFVAGLAVGGYALDLNPKPTPEPVQSILVVTATPLPATETPTPTITPAYTPTSELSESDTGTNVETTTKWQFTSDVSALDDSTTYNIALGAENSVKAWLSNPIPVIVIRCHYSQYDVYVYADSQLDSTLDDEVFTRVRYGDNPPINITMSESTTGEAMFFPDAKVAIRNLLTVDRLVVGYTPYNAGPVEAIFDLTGMETAMQPLFEACGRP